MAFLRRIFLSCFISFSSYWRTLPVFRIDIEVSCLSYIRETALLVIRIIHEWAHAIILDEICLTPCQGFCPGLTHAQRYGITYAASDENPEESSITKQATGVENSPTSPVPSNSVDIESPSGVKDHDTNEEPVEDLVVPQLETEAQVANEAEM